MFSLKCFRKTIRMDFGGNATNTSHFYELQQDLPLTWDGFLTHRKG